MFRNIFSIITVSLSINLTFDPEQCLGHAPLQVCAEAVGRGSGEQHGQGKQRPLPNMAAEGGMGAGHRVTGATSSEASTNGP